MPDPDLRTAAIPEVFRALVDDAAVFPPGNAPLDKALAQHREHREAAYADLVGPLVVAARQVDELAALVADDLDPLAISVVLADPGAVDETVRAVAAAPALRLRALEVKLDPEASRPDQVAEVAERRHALAEAGLLDAEALAYVEVPRPADEDAAEALDAVAAYGLRAKLRTGGESADLFPSEDELARWILAAAERDLAVKCTAGLHHAVRHRAGGTGFEHHGYLNVLLATARARAGGGLASVTSQLGERDADTVADAVRTAGHADLAAARRGFASYGSCSVEEPLADLAALNLLPGHAAIDREGDA